MDNENQTRIQHLEWVLDTFKNENNYTLTIDGVHMFVKAEYNPFLANKLYNEMGMHYFRRNSLFFVKDNRTVILKLK